MYARASVQTHIKTYIHYSPCSCVRKYICSSYVHQYVNKFIHVRQYVNEFIYACILYIFTYIWTGRQVCMYTSFCMYAQVEECVFIYVCMSILWICWRVSLSVCVYVFVYRPKRRHNYWQSLPKPVPTSSHRVRVNSRSATQCNTLQHTTATYRTTLHYTTLHYTTSDCSDVQWVVYLLVLRVCMWMRDITQMKWRSATHCNACEMKVCHLCDVTHSHVHTRVWNEGVPHIATHCNTPHHTATHRNKLQCNVAESWPPCMTCARTRGLSHSTPYCNTLQRTAAHCNTL